MATGKYQISINGFTCMNETWDDALNRDGQHDEVYFRVNTKVVKNDVTIANQDTLSAVLGDVKGFPGRIQVGSAENRFLWNVERTGGIISSDSYPNSEPWRQLTDPSGRDYPPYTIWEGELTEGNDEVVFITPTIWEYDTGDDALTGWVEWLDRTNKKYGERAKEVIGGIWPESKPYFDAVSLGIEIFATLPGVWNPLGSPRNRPIGLQRDPANPADGTLFNPIIIALSYKTAEYLISANLAGKGEGIFAHIYEDDPLLRGVYVVWLQIKKIGGTNVWPDGSVLKETSDPKIYVMYGNAKFWIPDPQTLFRLFPTGWNVVQVVPDGTLNPIDGMPKDGTILREEHNAYVWLIEASTKRHITTPSVLTRLGGWHMVRVVPDFSLDKIPVGQPVN
jgi:hypothetical protein